MTIVEMLVGILISAGIAFLGRWLQLNPRKIMLRGQFVAENSFGARLFRLVVACVGSLLVFGGTVAAMSTLLSPLPFNSTLLLDIATIFCGVCGVAAAIYVRTEVKSRPVLPHYHPFGWWP
jgi:hypothetical protein